MLWSPRLLLSNLQCKLVCNCTAAIGDDIIPFTSTADAGSMHTACSVKCGLSSDTYLMLTHVKCSFYDYDAPIYTMSRFLPPSKVADATISNSILGDGTVIRAGSRISHSVVGLRSLIQENCIVEDTLLMGSDYYETLEECALIPGCLPMGLGKLAE